VIAELIGRLVAASIRNPTARRFPAADSIGQSGEDGYLDTETGFHPFIPKGKSIWEFGTGSDSKKKATLDYKKRPKPLMKAYGKRQHSSLCPHIRLHTDGTSQPKDAGFNNGTIGKAKLLSLS
jgi:hypothetical protein